MHSLSVRAVSAAVFGWILFAAFPAAANDLILPVSATATLAAVSDSNLAEDTSAEDAGTGDATSEDNEDKGTSEEPHLSQPSAKSQEPLSTTRHQMDIEGGGLSYTATAGRLPLSIDGNAKADMFFVSYQRDGGGDAKEKRPITFVFNGGPGAASAYLHLGALGPQRLVLDDDGAIPPPPARLAVNHETWLTFTDLVFVDPVGTGYSRRAEQSSGSQSAFWETRQDIRALAEFIRIFLTLNNRHLSPMFLAGESYGGFRAAALAETLITDVGVGLNGIVLISPVLEFSLMYGDDYTLLPWALLLPAYAATALAHDRSGFGDGAADLAEALKEVERFSLTHYLTGLAEGERLSGEARTMLYQQIADYTGLPVDVVERYRGRIPRDLFAKQLLGKEARVVSLYDGSVAGVDSRPGSERGMNHDPVLQGLTAPLTSAFVAYVRNDLGYHSDLRYELLNRDVFRAWQWRQSERAQGYLGMADQLKAAMSLNHRLQTLITHGYYDLVTSYFASRYVVDQMALDPAIRPNVTLETYNGGHMFYTRAEARKQLVEDARDFYRNAILGRAHEADRFQPAERLNHTQTLKKHLPRPRDASTPAIQPG